MEGRQAVGRRVIRRRRFYHHSNGQDGRGNLVSEEQCHACRWKHHWSCLRLARSLHVPALVLAPRIRVSRHALCPHYRSPLYRHHREERYHADVGQRPFLVSLNLTLYAQPSISSLSRVVRCKSRSLSGARMRIRTRNTGRSAWISSKEQGYVAVIAGTSDSSSCEDRKRLESLRRTPLLVPSQTSGRKRSETSRKRWRRWILQPPSRRQLWPLRMRTSL